MSITKYIRDAKIKFFYFEHTYFLNFFTYLFHWYLGIFFWFRTHCHNFSRLEDQQSAFRRSFSDYDGWKFLWIIARVRNLLTYRKKIKSNPSVYNRRYISDQKLSLHHFFPREYYYTNISSNYNLIF